MEFDVAICCRRNEFGGEGGGRVVADKVSLKDVACVFGVVSECSLGAMRVFIINIPLIP